MIDQRYYIDRDEVCRSCGRRAYELHQNTPLCRYCLKEAEAQKLKHK